ncbi:HORMA domain containing protein [Rubricoccus marinus]|jgi:hypothetical protein|uniref:HORMA domain containing protein n=1 Tax=Rubricoccus marinus TaxID=716817 RepID=A0A259TTR4_9BACT|nr:HORMA domain containing protein [Rubricoccus marinus]OZC01142.1 HORMA domain containing protein [Rubricoccus marinus]
MSVVAVNTFTHSVTYVSDQMLRSLKTIVVRSGLSAAKLGREWESIDLALRTWLGTRDLERVVLEVLHPTTGALVTRWDATLTYSYDGEGEMWADTDALRFAIAKAGAVASTCDYRVLLHTKSGRPDVAGWSPTTYTSTDGFVRHSVGTTIGTHAIGSDFAYWRPL